VYTHLGTALGSIRRRGDVQVFANSQRLVKGFVGPMNNSHLSRKPCITMRFASSCGVSRPAWMSANARSRERSSYSSRIRSSTVASAGRLSTSVCTCCLKGLNRHVHVALGVVRRAHQRAALHVFQAPRQPFLAVAGEGVGVNELGHFEVALGGLQVLTQRQDV